MTNIELRKITLKDAEDLFDYGSNAEVTKYLTWGPYKHLDDAIDAIKHHFFTTDLLEYALQYLPTNKMIGTIGVTKITNNQLFIGYVLHQDFHKQGLMTKIIKHFLNIVINKYPHTDIYAEVIDNNCGSIKVLEKNNFMIIKEVKLMRKNVLVKGKLLKLMSLT